jgi:hypothetical protein
LFNFHANPAKFQPGSRKRESFVSTRRRLRDAPVNTLTIASSENLPLP